jgi:hypothetical protein
VAYDPISGRTLVVFLSDFKRVIGLLYQGASQIGNPLVLTLAQFPSARSPQVAWHPDYGGWLLSYQDDTAPTRHVFVPVNSDGVQAFGAASGFFIDAKDNSLACPAPQSALAADLRFDELPGATTFADSSGRGNNATCTGASCPMAGLAGAPNDPTSDYSVQFDGVDDFLTLNRTVQDDFTIAFWLKAPQADIRQTLVESGDFNTNGFRLSLSNGGLVARVPGMGIQMQGRIDDGQWHHVAFSRSKGTGRIDVYVDRNRVIGIEGTAGATLNGSSDIRIGMQRNNTLPLNATLDGFKIFGGAMGQDTVGQLINRTLQSYCVAGGTIDTAVYWAKVQASKPDVRGGRVSASGSLTLTVDADLPTAQITSVQDNELVGPAQVIGGVAGDATAGVLAVEASVNNGAWQAAQGSNTWAFSLAGQNGPISVRVRAIDAVGNFGAPSAPLNLIVDATPPAVTVNAPQNAIVPTKSAAGVWQVNLSGTASDVNGIKPQSLQVRLEQQSGVGKAQTMQQAALNGSNWSINYLLDPGLYDPTGAYTVTVGVEDAVGNQAAAAAVVRLDAQGPNATLNDGDATRKVITQTLTIGGVVADENSTAGIDKLEIAFTPVEQIASLPPGLTGAQAEAQLNRVWTPVALAQRGPGVPATAWSFQVPTGLENLYQIDVRGTDMLGNVAISANLWRGSIDTADPRMVMTSSPTGASFLDAGGRRRYAVQFVCAAFDRNLDESSFACRGKSVAEPTRSFTDIPQLQTLFPDLTLRTGLALSYTLWMTSTAPTATVHACDTFGRCARASTPAGAALAGPDTILAAPQAVIVAPANDEIVAGGDTISVTVAAEAASLLKTITVRLDGEIVQTLSFDQLNAPATVQRTIALAVGSEGPHTLVAEATDWAGATQTTAFPLTFTLDKAPPALAIDTSTLTNADTWQAQSGILRFSGTASDSVGLAAVKVRVDDGEFADATFAGGAWQTALYVPDPEGRTLTVTARAIDRAGRTTEVTQQVGTALSSADAPDTAIASTPPNPSSNPVSFTFGGTGNTAAFKCQIDDGEYLPCSSPQQYTDLSKGSHVFRVKAIDSRGFADLSPATYTWTVAASQPDVSLMSGPAGTTTERSATFVFAGDGNAVAFECSLDGAAYTFCTSPQVYTGLAEGEHTFLVRALGGANQVGAAARYTWMVSNAPPLANSQSVTVPANRAVDILLSAVDTDPLDFAVITPPAHGVLTGDAPVLTYTPDTGYRGLDSFTFSATDREGGIATAVVSITVVTAQSDVKVYLPGVYRESRTPSATDAETGAVEPERVEPEAVEPEGVEPEAAEKDVESVVNMYLPDLQK